MTKLILLRPYDGKPAGDTIEVSDADAQAFLDAWRAKVAPGIKKPIIHPDAEPEEAEATPPRRRFMKS